jgi:MYXO-CTERM domain-containing protein
MAHPRRIGLVCVLAAACGSEATPPEAVRTSQAAIQGGMTDSNDSYVVAIIERSPTQGGLALCSGSLLAPNLVATARHCVAALATTQIDCSTSTFGGLVPASNLAVTTDTSVSNASAFHGVSKIIVPSGSNQTAVCGNDLALLILTQPFALPAYVTPVLHPPMTDHSTYSTTITAIGYGVDTPTDMMGATAGIRRIRENIDLSCISGDSTFVDCLANPMSSQFVAANEFVTIGDTCEGDSGSGAFEQRNFNAGTPVSFGVLSRGGVSADGGTCLTSIYTRFDAWASLLASAAVEAAQMGGYVAPAWAGASSEADGSACLAQAAPCNANSDCCANNCLSHDDGATFVCATCDAQNPCDTGLTCQAGVCVMASDTATAASPPANRPRGGCTVAGRPDRNGPNEASWPLGLFALTGFALARRRSRRALRAI